MKRNKELLKSAMSVDLFSFEILLNCLAQDIDDLIGAYLEITLHNIKLKQKKLK